MKRKSNKKLTIALLALLGVVSTAGTYAYWQEIVNGADKIGSSSITIGHGSDVTTFISLNDPTIEDKHLVPSAFLKDVIKTDEKAVDEVSYTYAVTWDKKIHENGTLAEGMETNLYEGEGTLEVTVESIKVKGDGETLGEDLKGNTAFGSTAENPIYLFDVSFNGGADSLAANEYSISFVRGTTQTPVNVKVTVKLNEPVDKDAYDVIADKKIVIELKFVVTPTGPKINN